MESKNNKENHKNYQNQSLEMRFQNLKIKLPNDQMKSYDPFELLFWSIATKPSLQPKSFSLVNKYIC
jgi:hypothetical protein